MSISTNPKFKQMIWPENNKHSEGVGILEDGTPVIVYIATNQPAPGGKSIDVLTVREIGKVLVHQAPA